MKKFLFMGAVATMLLGVTSCSDAFDDVSNGQEVNVQFTANLGEKIESRVISDGTGATELTFAVFENGTEIEALQQTVAVVDKKATVTTKLVKGHTYSFVFWAQNPECPAYDKSDMSAITVNYNANCNDESRDAFYEVLKDYNVTAAFTEDVILHRPFAQINFAASDAAGVNNIDAYKSKVTVTGVPTTLNTLDRTVTGSQDVTFALATIPNEELKGYPEYKYVAMNYILAAEDKELKNEVKMTVNDGTQDVNEVTVANCPVQRNYRTNIIGDLFTVGGNFNIFIDPIYYNDDYEIDMNATYYELTTTSDDALQEIITQINTDKPQKAIIRIANDVEARWECKYSDDRTLIANDNTTTKEIVFEGSGEGCAFRAYGNGVRGVQSGPGKLTFKNLTVYDDTRYNAEDGNNAWEFAYLEWKGNIDCENVTFADAIQPEGDESVQNFTNCKFIADGNAKRDPAKQSSEYAAWICAGKIRFTNCEFTGYRGAKIHEEYGTEVTSVHFDGCTFHDLSQKPGIAVGRLLPAGDSYTTKTTYTLSKTAVLSITNCTFENTQPGDQGNYKYETDSDLSRIIFTDENNTVVKYNVASVGGTEYSTLDAAIAAAEAGATITLAPGTYNFSSMSKSVKIVGSDKEKSIVEYINKAYGCNGVDVYFENLTLRVGSENYKGFQHSNSETYKNIIFEGGHLTIYGTTANFEGCIFNQSTYDYCFWTYGATTTNVTNCVFNTVGKAVKVYIEGNSVLRTVNISNSTFNVTSRGNGNKAIKAAVEIDNTANNPTAPFNVNITNATVNGHDSGENSGNTLWNCDAGSKATVVVDGETVYSVN